MFLVDTLSRAHPPEIHFCEALALSDSRIQDIRQASINDLVLTTLYQVIQNGWPTKVSDCIHTYFNIRDKSTVQNGLIFKGHCLVIPAEMRKELLDTIHSTHIGTEGCLS